MCGKEEPSVLLRVEAMFMRSEIVHMHTHTAASPDTRTTYPDVDGDFGVLGQSVWG